MTEYIDGHRWPQRAISPSCSCGKPFPEDGGREGVCECCSTCTPAESETPSTAPDQQTRPGVPDSLTALLHLPGVYVQADEDNCQVVIGMDADIARAVAQYAPNPLQVQLAAKLIDAALADITEEQILTTRERQISGGLR